MKAKALVAEFIGTFTLIFVGVGAGAAIKDVSLTGVAIAHGVAIAVMVSALGAISGGHFNPSVTFGIWVGHKISTTMMLLYWVAQIAGGLAGAFLIYYCIPQPGNTGGLPAFSPETNLSQAFILEAVGAFFLTLVVYGTAVDKRAPKVGGLFIGLTITIAILCFGNQTGASINPARYLGPAIALKNIDSIQMVAYLFGPLAGGAIAGILYNYFLMEKEAPLPA